MLPRECETVDELAALSINKTRPMTQAEVWERYEKVCKQANVMPLWDQLKPALTRLYKAGRIVVVDGQEKRIRLK